MQISAHIRCVDFPCPDALHECYWIPSVEVDPGSIKVILVSETSACEPADNYYTGGAALFARTTLQAFQEAGAGISNFDDLLAMGIYLTTAVKCGKSGYAVATNTILNCSFILERELALFPAVQAYLLMGDVAIKALNAIAKRQGEPRVIPAGSTYKIRDGEFTYRGRRVFPSYLQAGPSYGIEKSKQRMIAHDIANALSIASNAQKALSK